MDTRQERPRPGHWSRRQDLPGQAEAPADGFAAGDVVGAHLIASAASVNSFASLRRSPAYIAIGLPPRASIDFAFPSRCAARSMSFCLNAALGCRVSSSISSISRAVMSSTPAITFTSPRSSGCSARDSSVALIRRRDVASSAPDVVSSTLSGFGLDTSGVEQHADQILSEWIESVGPDCQALTAAAGPLADIENLHSVAAADLQRAGKHETWQTALTAYDRLSAFTAGQRALVAAVGVSVRPEHRPLLLTDPDLDVVDRVTALARGATVDPWHAARARAQLNPATVSELKQRVAEYDAEMARRRAEEAALRQPDGFDNARPRRQVATP